MFSDQALPVYRFGGSSHLKSHYLAGFITNEYEVLDVKVEESIRALQQKPETLRSVCRTHSD